MDGSTCKTQFSDIHIMDRKFQGKCLTGVFGFHESLVFLVESPTN